MGRGWVGFKGEVMRVLLSGPGGVVVAVAWGKERKGLLGWEGRGVD